MIHAPGQTSLLAVYEGCGVTLKPIIPFIYVYPLYICPNLSIIRIEYGTVRESRE